MARGPETPTTPSRRRLTLFYGLLAVMVVVVATLVISAGQDREAQKPIAGGYDVTRANACLGEKFDVKQSGRFVNFDNPDGSLGGRLEVDEGKLTGDVDCVGGGTVDFDGRAGNGRLVGILDGRRVVAELKRDPPEAGALKPRAPNSVAGDYKLSPRSPCLGAKLVIEGGSDVDFLTGGKTIGTAEYEDGKLEGKLTCPRGGETKDVVGEAVNRTITLTLLTPGTELLRSGSAPPGAERISAAKQREAGSRYAAFFIAVVVVMLVARLFGMASVAIGQPRVMGEVVAGITLGPTILGAIAPELQSALFPEDIIPFIGVVAQLGLIFYMFMVGLEIDPSQLKGRIGQVAAISNASVALPMMLGIAVALPIYELVGPDKKFVAFALFMGVSMSITAFPVLARILVERRMLKRPVGALALACAAVDDVTAWFLIAIATAVAVAGSGSDVLETIALAVLFCLVMGLRRAASAGAGVDCLRRGGHACRRAGSCSIFAGVLLAAYTTEEIGIALIFGAFVMGLVMPRHAELTEDVTRRIEDFVVTLLLPLFFAFTGLKTNIGLLDRPELWLMTGGAARDRDRRQARRSDARRPLHRVRLALVGRDRHADEHPRAHRADRAQPRAREGRHLGGAVRDARDHGARHHVHGGPALKLLDPKNELGAPVEEELEEAREVVGGRLPGDQGARGGHPRRSAGGARRWRSCGRWRSRWRAPSRRAS